MSFPRTSLGGLSLLNDTRSRSGDFATDPGDLGRSLGGDFGDLGGSLLGSLGRLFLGGGFGGGLGRDLGGSLLDGLGRSLLGDLGVLAGLGGDFLVGGTTLGDLGRGLGGPSVGGLGRRLDDLSRGLGGHFGLSGTLDSKDFHGNLGEAGLSRSLGDLDMSCLASGFSRRFLSDLGGSLLGGLSGSLSRSFARDGGGLGRDLDRGFLSDLSKELSHLSRDPDLSGLSGDLGRRGDVRRRFEAPLDPCLLETRLGNFLNLLGYLPSPGLRFIEKSHQHSFRTPSSPAELYSPSRWRDRSFPSHITHFMAASAPGIPGGVSGGDPVLEGYRLVVGDHVYDKCWELDITWADLERLLAGGRSSKSSGPTTRSNGSSSSSDGVGPSTSSTAPTQRRGWPASSRSTSPIWNTGTLAG